MFFDNKIVRDARMSDWEKAHHGQLGTAAGKQAGRELYRVGWKLEEIELEPIPLKHQQKSTYYVEAYKLARPKGWALEKQAQASLAGRAPNGTSSPGPSQRPIIPANAGSARPPGPRPTVRPKATARGPFVMSSACSGVSNVAGWFKGAGGKKR